MREELNIRDLSLAECKVDSKEWIRLYLDGKHNELVARMIGILGALAKPESCLVRIDSQMQHFIDTLCKNIGYFFSQPDFVVTDETLQVKLMGANSVIANLFELSCFGSSDVFAKQLLYQPNNLAKLLALYNAKSSIDINYEAFINHENNRLVGSWYGSFFYGVSPITSQIQKNLSKHLSYPPSSLPYTQGAMLGYFESTYADSELDRIYKSLFNASAKERLRGIKFVHKPNKKKIAIISAKWRDYTAVYKSISPYIKALSKEFELTLIYLGKESLDRIEKSFFRDVKYVAFNEKGNIDVSQIIKNDFAIAIYTDIGMSGEDILLSNSRIAPLQAVMYGHPVSTFGSEIDFFIGGEDVELEGLAERNYSERLVFVKGMGAIPVKSELVLDGVGGGFEDKRIAFLGSYPKLNHQCIDAFYKIKNVFDNELLKFIFILFGMERNQAFLLVKKFLTSKLGANTDVNHVLPYKEYMQKLHSATICLDAYPFGGYNTVVDALHLGKPVVTWEGTKAYNRLASAILRRLGLNELVATSQEEYISIALKLLSDKEFYEKVVNHISQIDIDSLLRIREDELEDFVTKIKMIISA